MLKALRKIGRAHGGMAAVEFALILPVMLALVFGAIEVTSALVCKADVSNTASTAADLIAQESSVGTTDMANVFSALNAMIYPNPIGDMKVIITSAIDDGRGGAIVAWSKANSGTARAPNSAVTVPAGLITTGGSVIMVEVTYDYSTPSNYLIALPLAMSNTFYTHPRRVPQVKWTS